MNSNANFLQVFYIFTAHVMEAQATLFILFQNFQSEVAFLFTFLCQRYNSNYS